MVPSRAASKLILVAAWVLVLPKSGVAEFRLSTFSADITIPLNHRCMGVLPTKSKKIEDPLFAYGCVLMGGDKPIVKLALDWCEVRNAAYDAWRTAIARAAGTDRTRVLVASLHQHDAPVTDAGAAALLAKSGLTNELYDESFHQSTIKRVALALKQSLTEAQPVTHIGMGQAEVKRIASNRRVELDNGRITFARGSNSGANPLYAKAPVGLIDPFLKTVSFWNRDTCLMELHSYATHPMSYYGRGEVTSDFVGLARERRRRDNRSIHQIYFSGCSGDVTAGKYNDGSPDSRVALTNRLYESMVRSSQSVQKVPLKTIGFRNVELHLPFHPKPTLTKMSLQDQLADTKLTVEKRILAAMGLASRLRVESRQAIDMPCVDLGDVRIVLFPGESFVGYQLMAQKMRSDKFIFSIGYGECWPGYIPTESSFDDNFDDSWLWVGRGSEERMRAGLKAILGQ